MKRNENTVIQSNSIRAIIFSQLEKKISLLLLFLQHCDNIEIFKFSGETSFLLAER